jgi:hypothetical protein
MSTASTTGNHSIAVIWLHGARGFAQKNRCAVIEIIQPGIIFDELLQLCTFNAGFFDSLTNGSDFWRFPIVDTATRNFP